MPKLLRWIAVLPAALLAIVLSAFLLHFALYQTLTGSGIVEPYPETHERVLLPLVSSIAFIWVGAIVAPNHKIKAAIFLFVLWLVILGSVVVIVMSGADFGGLKFKYEGGGLATVMALIGAIIGLCIVYKQFKPKNHYHKVDKNEEVLLTSVHPQRDNYVE